MTFRSNAPRAEGIINCLHCINVSFVLDPARNRVSGNPGGVGKASNVEINDGKKGKKYGKLRKCCSSALTTREGTYTIKQPFTPFLAVQLICLFLKYAEA
jgi:hypothetical protein